MARFHCNDHFWYRWDPETEILTRHVHDEHGTRCHPLSLKDGLRVRSPPIFLGGALECQNDVCVTEDLRWTIDLVTLRACRLHAFHTGIVRALCGCPRGRHFVALLKAGDTPLVHVTPDGWFWLPGETSDATRARACDVNFARVALFMSHTSQVVVWDRKSNKILRFASCPGIRDFVTCCFTGRIYGLTFEPNQKIVTFDSATMDIIDTTDAGDGMVTYGKLHAVPCFPTAKTTPTPHDKERLWTWHVGGDVLGVRNGKVVVEGKENIVGGRKGLSS